MFQCLKVKQVEIKKEVIFFSLFPLKEFSSANIFILNIIPFEKIRPRSFKIYQDFNVTFSIFLSKNVRFPRFSLGGWKKPSGGQEELGNDIFQLGYDSPIIIPNLNFSPAHSKKNHQKPSVLPRRVKKPIWRVGGSQAMTYFNLDLIV